MGVDIKLISFNRLPTGRIVDTIFERSSRETISHETVTITRITYTGDYFDNFRLKENLMSHLFEEPVDTFTWLKIKH